MKITSRELESLATQIDFKPVSETKYSKLILTASDDTGVMLNGGKNGSKYGPTAVINSLLKFNNHYSNSLEKILVQEIWPKKNAPFEQLQRDCHQQILNQMNEYKTRNILHLGGGHDHIFPLLLALDSNETYDNILVINLDAHCDTRVDAISHSGTPFRDFDKNGTKQFHLIQVGIHKYANSTSTLSELERGSGQIIFHETDEQLLKSKLDQAIENCPFKIDEKCAVVLSLDCDGLAGRDFSAVSCVNSTGLSAEFVLKLIQDLNQLAPEYIFGVYEYNPVYDNASFQSRRLLTHIIYEYLNTKNKA